MNENSKCFIKKLDKSFEEITYKELVERTASLNTYKSKKFIHLHGMLLEVTSDEYKDYHKERERNKYAKRVLQKLNIVSIDRLNEDENFDEKEIIADTNTNIEEETLRKIEIDELSKALHKLSSEEYTLIKNLFFNNISLREYSRKSGIPLTTLYDKKEKIIKKLKKLLKI